MSAHREVHGDSLGLARSLLALSTGATLLVHSSAELFFPAGVRTNTVGGTALWAQQLSFFSLAPQAYLEPLRWLSIGCLALIASGWRPRLTAVPHWWISFSFYVAAFPVEGGDQIAAVISLLLLPICLTDRRRWHWQRASKQDASSLAYSAWLVIRLQVAGIYLHAAVGKLRVEEWANGTAMYYWFDHPAFGAPSWLAGLTSAAAANPWFVTLLTWGAILLEFTLAGALFAARRWWPYFLGPAVLFHAAIGLVHGLVTFGIAMAGAALLYLWDPSRPLRPYLRFWKRTETVPSLAAEASSSS